MKKSTLALLTVLSFVFLAACASTPEGPDTIVRCFCADGAEYDPLPVAIRRGSTIYACSSPTMCKGAVPTDFEETEKMEKDTEGSVSTWQKSGEEPFRFEQEDLDIDDWTNSLETDIKDFGEHNDWKLQDGRDWDLDDD